MKLRILLLLLIMGVSVPSFSQNCVRAGWAKKYGVSGIERIDEMCADSGRLSFTVAGFFESSMTLGSTTITSPTGRGYYIARFDTAGNPLMLALLGYATAASGVYIDARQVVTDDEGNVYVAGACGGNSVTIQGNTYNYTTFGIMFVAKFAANGAPLWVRSISNGHQSMAYSLAVDTAGYAYVNGFFEGPSLAFDNDTVYNNSATIYDSEGFVAALDPNGQFLWAHNYGTSGNDAGYSMALDGHGHLFLTGNLDFGNALFSSTAGVSTIRQDWNFFVAKYTTSGTALWVRTVDSYGTGSHMYSYRGTCDEAGNFYVTGEFDGTYAFGNSMMALSMTASDDAFLAKFRPDGGCAWVKTGGGTNGDRAYDVNYYQGKIAWCGNIFSNNPVFGNLTVPVPGTTTFIAMTDTAGTMLWARTYCTTLLETASGCFIDASGIVYVGGTFTQSETWYPVTLAPSGGADGYVVKFKQSASANPVVNAGPDRTTSCGVSVQLTGSSVTPAGSTYQWQGPNGFTTSTLSPSVNPGFTFNYTLTANYQGCINIDTMLVTVSPNGVNADAGMDVTICQGDSVQLNATSTPAGSTYSWTPTFGGLSNINIANPWAKPAQTTDYIVCAINGNCRDYDTVRVTVNPRPYISLVSSYTTCAGNPVTLTAGPVGPTYSWTPATGLSSTNTNTTIATPASTQTYSVTATTAEGCTKTVSFLFNVNNNNVAPTVTVQPVSQTICAANQVSFTCGATGSASIIYRWEMNTGSGWAQVPAAAPYTGTLTSSMTINPINATMNGYQFRCRTYSSCSPTTYTNAATLTVSGTPVISVQPPNRNICPANNTTMGVTVPGTGYTYQWQGDFGSGFVNLTNAAPYSGVNNATLNITNATAGMNGYQYRVIVTGCSPSASATSNSALLSVGQPPSIQTQPVNDTDCVGGTTTFSVVQTGGTTYAWQYHNGSSWQFLTNTAPYSGVNTPTLTITPLSMAQDGLPIRCRISSSCSVITYSDTVAVTIAPALAVTSSPSNVSACPGDNISFTTGASNAASYQWEVNSGSGFVALTNSTPYSGVNSAVLSVSPVNAAMNAYQYRCVVAGICASTATTAAATLNITPAVNIQLQPVNESVCAGSFTTFNINAANATAYQWEANTGSGWSALANTSPYSGVTTSSLSVNPVMPAMDGYQYRCIVYNACNVADTTTVAILSLPAAASVTTAPVNDTTCIGLTSTFSVAANNAASYQWEENTGAGWVILSNAAPYSGVSTATLTINPVSAAMNGYAYRCVMANTCGVLTSSDSATIVFGSGVAVLGQPSAATVCENEPAVFSCTASGAVSYQWEADFGSGFSALSNSGVYSGVTTAQLNISSATPALNGGLFRCVVSGCSGSSTTTAATLTVHALPVVALASQPVVCINWTPVTLTGGSPSGGIYSGTAVSGGVFDPAAAGAGQHTIVYTYSDLNGCSDTAQQQITVDLCTGLDQNSSANGILLFPNPAASSATLVLGENGTTGRYTIEVLSSHGQLLSVEQHTVTGKTNLEMSFRDYARGVYFVRVSTDSGTQTIRLVLI